MATRRDVLRLFAATAGGALIPRELWALEPASGKLPQPKSYTYRKPSQPVTAAICGYGGRGGYYGWMATQMPDEWKVIQVAEPIGYRREAAASRHSLAANQQFTTWEQILDGPKVADVLVISMPDNLHYKPAMRALEAGYHLLLEKPIAQSWKQCAYILHAAGKAERIVAVCHVLRYAPFFVQLHEVIRSGMIGDVTGLQHLEPIQYMHFAHSYVRGPWHDSRESNPSLLAKSCHDLDLIRWFMGRPCERVSSFGGLKHFTEAYAPEGAPKHCSEGCPVEARCPYHAQTVYVTQKLWSDHHIVTPDRSSEGILRAMKGTQYDACVFRHDNDVCDHQIVSMQFEGGATAAFNMEANSSYGGRRTRVFGTLGDIIADERYLDVYDFEARKGLRWDVNADYQDLGGHGGGDMRLVRDLTQAISQEDPGILTTSLDVSMESHLIGFRAEESRKKGGAVMNVGKP